MLQRGNVIIKTQTLDEAIREAVDQVAPFVRSRIEAPILRFSLNEKKNVIIVDGDLEYASVAFHFVRVNERIVVRVFCGGEDSYCWLCNLQKYYPERIGKTKFYCCFTVLDEADQGLKILSLPIKYLVHVYSAVKDKRDVFLRGVALSIVRKDKYEYFVTFEYSEKGVARFGVKVKDKKPYDYFQYFAPFTREELGQLGFDLSLVTREKYVKCEENEEFVNVDVKAKNKEEEEPFKGMLSDEEIKKIFEKYGEEVSTYDLEETF